MNIAILRRSFFAVVLTFSSTVSWAQLSNIEGLNFKLGDDLVTVKRALQTTLDPETLDTGNNVLNGALPNKSVLFLRTKGIKVFFNRKDTVESIRLEPPFEGKVQGVKLGDGMSAVRAMKGKPLKAPWGYGPLQFYLYVLDDTAYIRFDITDADGVQAITVQK
jgi:hypothetical protein